MVDQTIRQAIMHCWMMLPEEERSLERVEKEIFRLVQRALQDLKEDITAFELPEAGESKPSGDKQLAKIRAKHPRAYERWTEAEDDLLRRRFKEGISIEELSKVLRRQSSAVRSRLQKLGLV
jgi:DNA-directed RNA polymerase specialized sigma24 family protein